MITLGRGKLPLAAWRAIYYGAPVAIDRSSRPRVNAGADMVRGIVARGEPVYGVNTGFGKLASASIAPQDLGALQRNLVLSHACGVGELLPPDVVRLVMALKIASLLHGVSGVRFESIEHLHACLAHDALPCIPAQGSVGASGDLAPLAHLCAGLMGIGDMMVAGERMPAAAALDRFGLVPLAPGPKEGLAFINGTQVSTALAMAAQFMAERVLLSALVTGAASTDAAKGSDGPFDPRLGALRGHQGHVDVATALRALMANSAIRASHRIGDPRIQDPYSVRCQPQVMGACLDLLRHTAATLETEANGVSDNPLLFPDTGEVLSGGNFHAESVAFAADELALALCEVGSLAERRIAMLIDPAFSQLPPFLTTEAGLNSGFMIPQVTAAALVAENRQKAFPASVDSIPTSANQEDHVSMATHGARRTLAIADNAATVIAIELLAAVQGLDFDAPLTSSAPLERVRAALRSRVPHLYGDRLFADDIVAAADLVRSGAVVDAAALDCWPSFDP